MHWTLLAFFCRAALLLALVLVYIRLWFARGHLVAPLRQTVAAFAVLLAWVSLASLLELLVAWPGAAAAAAAVYRWVWLPYAVGAGATLRLLVHLWLTDPTQRHD